MKALIFMKFLCDFFLISQTYGKHNQIFKNYSWNHGMGKMEKAALERWNDTVDKALFWVGNNHLLPCR